MKIIAVSRLRNEEDIVEAFIRHHAPWLAAHVFIDNGSTDGTLRILHALRAEGLPIMLFQNEFGASVEAIYNTLLYRVAGLELAADWVVFLDCDEFLTLREDDFDLAARLARVPRDVRCVRMPMVNYLAPTAATASQLNVVERLVRRETSFQLHGKVCIRGSLEGTLVGHGNHSAVIDGQVTEGQPQQDLVLSHYPDRSPFQMMAKAVLGRLKVIAAGEAAVAAHWGHHHIEPFEHLRRDLPNWLAATEATMRARMASDVLIEDPLRYRGGALRHTRATDTALHAMSSLIGGASALARMVGRAHDLSPEVQADMFQQATAFHRIF